MTHELFDYSMTDHDTIIMSDGERLYQIITDNGMDALYIISTPADVEADVAAGMRRLYGRRGPGKVESVEDYTGHLKWDQAYELSKWSKYPATYEACTRWLDSIPGETLDRLDAHELAQLVDLIHDVYHAGKVAGREEREE